MKLIQILWLLGIVAFSFIGAYRASVQYSSSMMITVLVCFAMMILPFIGVVYYSRAVVEKNLIIETQQEELHQAERELFHAAQRINKLIAVTKKELDDV